MTLSTTLNRAVARIHGIYSELDYVNRRLFEVTTGVSASKSTRS
jgi:hypothetical protein